MALAGAVMCTDVRDAVGNVRRRLRIDDERLVLEKTGASRRGDGGAGVGQWRERRRELPSITVQ
jgi:hypothetical protein